MCAGLFRYLSLGTGHRGSSGAVNPQRRPQTLGLGWPLCRRQPGGTRGQPADMCPPGPRLSLQPPLSNYCLRIPKVNPQL